MKHVYPVRHPVMPEDAGSGATTASRDGVREPALPHEQDESSHSQESATPKQRELGRKAYGNATDGTTDTDRGPEMDRIYNEKVAPDRGDSGPRR
jgi:hypothetical protein